MESAEETPPDGPGLNFLEFGLIALLACVLAVLLFELLR